MVKPRQLSLYEQVEALTARIRKEAPQLGHGFEARASLALSIAATLERAEDKLVASLTKELRALIAELADGIPRAGDQTPFGSDLTAAASRPAPVAVPAPVRDTKKPGAGDARPGRSQGRRGAGNTADAVAAVRGRRAGRDRPGDG